MQGNPNSLQQLLQGVAKSLDLSLIAALALFLSAMICMLIIGNPMIAWLQNKRWKKGITLDETWMVREDTPDTHQAKAGTPSMGGIGIAAASLLAYFTVSIYLLPGEFSGENWNQVSFVGIVSLLILPLVFFCHALLGFADDWSKASGRGGLRARSKLIVQLILALGFVGAALPFANTKLLAEVINSGSPLSSIFLLGLLYVLIIMATSNAVNLTDGIDGLAAGLAVQAGLALLCVFSTFSADFFPLHLVVNQFFWIALAGACLGFLKFNRYKARVFMGDTGSLAIGAALGAGAILQHAVFLLPFIGFIYFVDMFSVIAQVFWFKYTKAKTGEGKRLFRRAPLHHHFELCGWSEWRVVLTFWAVNLLTSAIGLWLWHIGVLPRWP